MNPKKHLALLLAVIVTIPCLPWATTTAAAAQQLTTNTIKAVQGVASVTNTALSNNADVPALQTVVASDGTVSVLSTASTNGKIQIYEWNAAGQPLRTLTFDKTLPLVGAFTRDAAGNYYIFFAEEVTEGATTANNMALVKYNSGGAPVNTFRLAAQMGADNFSSVKVPFAFGSCRMEISGDLIAVYFGRRMFMSSDKQNHQASYGFILNKDSFAQIAGRADNLIHMPYSSHSFNQFILPSNNGFLFADHGDSYPRAFMLSYLSLTDKHEVRPFTFKGEVANSNTYAELGGLAETANGFLFLGAYEKNSATSADINDARNLFILTTDKSLGGVTAPVWLTDYTDQATQQAIAPKIVRIDTNEYLVMWQVTNAAGTGDAPTYYTTIDSTGKTIRPIAQLLNAPLNRCDILRYNTTSKQAQWAANDGSTNIVLYSFDPRAAATTATTIAPTLTGLQTASFWAQQPLQNALDANLIPSDLQTNYKNNITRGEFCRLALRYLEVAGGLTAQEYIEFNGLTVKQNLFTDTTNKDILIAATLGIAGGIGDGLFNPDGLITREQAAVMVANTMRILGIGATSQAAPLYTDNAAIAAWAQASVAFVSNRGIMGSTGNNAFQPKGQYTREQAVVTFLNALSAQ